MRTNTRPLIEDRPPKTSDRAVVFTVVLGITVLSLLLFAGLLLASPVICTLVGLGISRASATGDVYNLTDVAKFSGTYVAAEAGLTLAGGMGGMVLRNQDGIVLHLRSTSRGARLQLGTSGMTIRLKQ